MNSPANPEVEDALLKTIQRYNWYHVIQVTDTIQTPGWMEPSVRRMQDFNLEALAALDLQNKRVLDIGCRDGLYCFAAERQSAREVIGIDNDLSRGATEFLIPYFRSKVQMHELNLYDLTPSSFGEFDVVMFPGVLYHLRYPFWALRLVRDVLKRGGVMILETAIREDGNRRAMLHCPIGPESPYDPSSCTFFNLKGLTDTLMSFGFTVSETKWLRPQSESPAVSTALARQDSDQPLLNRATLVCQLSTVDSPGDWVEEYWEGTHSIHSGGGVLKDGRHHLSGMPSDPMTVEESAAVPVPESPSVGNETEHVAGHPCWCGHSQLADFSPDYFICENCQTLVVREWPPEERFAVTEDEKDFYGRSYYESHVVQDYGLPSLAERARNDLPERCEHWMRTVLKYQLPPARTLELGCAHGGFVALMRWAGFDAMGLEMSPSLVPFAKSAFGVSILTGTVESQEIEPGSLDLILHFDVLEHLPDPRATMQHCLSLLKPEGIMVIQTPCYPVGRTHAQMIQDKDRFLEQLKPSEHLYLFSQPSMTRLFAESDAHHVYFEPAIFSHYDMFAVVSRRKLTPHSGEEVAQALCRRPEGRLVQAMLDAAAQREVFRKYYEVSEADRQARLQELLKTDSLYKELRWRSEELQARYEDLMKRKEQYGADRVELKKAVKELKSQYKQLQKEQSRSKAELAKLRSPWSAPGVLWRAFRKK